MMEPKRLWRRYVILNPRFMVRAAWQLLHSRMRPALASLFPQGLPGCDLLVSSDYFELTVSNQGEASMALSLAQVVW